MKTDWIDTIVTPDGVKRALGLVPSKLFGDFIPPPNYGDSIVPTSELAAFDNWPAPLRVLDQGQWNACTYFSSAQALMFARYQSGQPFVALDPLFPYLRVTGGRNVGTNLLQASQVLAADGMPPMGVSPRLDTPKQAKRFRIELSASLTSYAELLSAVARRRPVVASVYVGPTYNQLDADGAMGISRGTANHAIFLGGGLKFSQKHGWMIKHCGSWSTAWGQGGFAWYTEAHYDSAGFGEAYTVDAVVEDLDDDDNPPKVTE